MKGESREIWNNEEQFHLTYDVKAYAGENSSELNTMMDVFLVNLYGLPGIKVYSN